MADNLKLSDIASTFIDKAMPCANVLLLLNNVRNSRKGEYDPSVVESIAQYKKLIDPDGRDFTSKASRIVQKIFFERSIRDSENFRWLVSIPDNELLELLVFYVAGRDYENSSIFNKLLCDFFQGRDINRPRFLDFINCSLGYFSVFICSNSESRDALMISILGDIQEKITSTYELKDDFTLSDEIAAASIESHFKDNFSGSLLEYAALKLQSVDNELLEHSFFSRYIRVNCPNNANACEIKKQFFRYIATISIEDLEERLCNVIHSFCVNNKGKLAVAEERICNELSFCFALKLLSEYAGFVVCPDNVYETNGSLTIKCCSQDQDEIQLIISSIEKKIPDLNSEGTKNTNIVTGEVGFNEDRIVDEFIDETACLLTAELSKSVYNGKLRTNDKINKKLIMSSKYDHPLFFYIVLEEQFQGDIAKKLSSSFPLLRFVMRSDDEDSLKFTEIESYHDFLDSIKVLIN